MSACAVVMRLVAITSTAHDGSPSRLFTSSAAMPDERRPSDCADRHSQPTPGAVVNINIIITC